MLFSFTPKLDMYVSWPFFIFIFLSQISFQNISIHRLLMFFVCLLLFLGGKSLHVVVFLQIEFVRMVVCCFQKFRNYFADTTQTARRFNAYKYHWSENRVPVILEVNQGSLDQIDPTSNRVLCSYSYKDMEGLTLVGTVDVVAEWIKLESFLRSLWLEM